MSSTPDALRWQRHKRILGGALELPTAQQQAYLQQHAADTAELRELQSLHAAGRSDNSLLDQGAQALADRMVQDRAHGDGTGRCIGGYQLLGLIAQGGMGQVYRAEPVAGGPPVAIKLVRQGWMDTALERRFHAERQILGRLDHPNLARLLDGGLADGLPYLVMELVEGEAIDVHCRRQQLALPALLQLFRTLCQVVHYAHGQGVVHRDLKPANVLVTHDGQVKLVDFGIAKQIAKGMAHEMAAERPERASNVTASGTSKETSDETRGQVPAQPSQGSARADASRPISRPINRAINQTALHTPPHMATATATTLRMMTLACASPEQVRGQAVTPASDIYALGVLLYRLLTGESPYAAAAAGDDGDLDLRNAICHARPQRPSQRVVGDAGRRLRGDLDAVVMKALHKDPAQRHASAQQLSDDLRRHLEGRPVHARRAWRRRALLWLQRRRVLAGLVLASGVGLTLGLGLAAHGWLQARQLAAQAQRQQAELWGWVQSAITLQALLRDQPGATAARQQLVQQALAQLELLSPDTLSTGRPRTVPPATAEQLLELAGAWLALSQVQAGTQDPALGDPQQAEAGLASAGTLFAQALQGQPDNAELQRQARAGLAEAQRSQALLYQWLGRGAEAQVAARQAVATARQRLEAEPASAAARLRDAVAQLTLAQVLDPRRAEQQVELQAALQAAGARLEALRAQATQLAPAAREGRSSESSSALAAEAPAARTSAKGIPAAGIPTTVTPAGVTAVANPADTGTALAEAWAEALADLHRLQGQRLLRADVAEADSAAQAVAELRQAVDLLAPLAEAPRPAARWLLALAAIRSLLAEAQQQSLQSRQALASTQQARDIVHALWSAEPQRPPLQWAFADAALGLSRLQLLAGDAVAAVQAATDAAAAWAPRLASLPMDRIGQLRHGQTRQALGQALLARATQQQADANALKDSPPPPDWRAGCDAYRQALAAWLPLKPRFAGDALVPDPALIIEMQQVLRTCR